MVAVVVALAATFLLLGSGLDTAYVIPRRLNRLAAMCIAGVCIAVSSILFQTATGNRILTPAVMGYEAVYLLFQALLILQMGVASVTVVSPLANAAMSVFVILAYAFCLQRWLFRPGRSSIDVLLLTGLVLTLVATTIAEAVQLVISPGEFAILLGFTQASLERAQPDQVLLSAVIVAAACLVVAKTLPVLDVLKLGRDQATALGVDGRGTVALLLALIAVFVSIS
ncbi:MAG: iron chelate uptake ABC transporter family permease subunit, partial [Microvirga sp.]